MLYEVITTVEFSSSVSSVCAFVYAVLVSVRAILSARESLTGIRLAMDFAISLAFIPAAIPRVSTPARSFFIQSARPLIDSNTRPNVPCSLR